MKKIKKDLRKNFKKYHVEKVIMAIIIFSFYNCLYIKDLKEES